jgi:hypothetical protein
MRFGAHGVKPKAPAVQHLPSDAVARSGVRARAPGNSGESAAHIGLSGTGDTGTHGDYASARRATTSSRTLSVSCSELKSQQLSIVGAPACLTTSVSASRAALPPTTGGTRWTGGEKCIPRPTARSPPCDRSVRLSEHAVPRSEHNPRSGDGTDPRRQIGARPCARAGCQRDH